MWTKKRIYFLIALLCGIVLLTIISTVYAQYSNPDRIALKKLDKQIEMKIEREKQLKMQLVPLAQKRTELQETLSGINHNMNKIMFEIDNINGELDGFVHNAPSTITEDEFLMNKICNISIHGNKSPLCDDRDMYWKLKKISTNKGLQFGQLIGITYAESHVGANFAKGCNGYNNRSGIKWKKNADGSTEGKKLPDINGCYMYNFGSIEEYRESFTNTIKLGYYDKGCITNECISKYYVKNDGVEKPGWSANVYKFMNN